MAVKAQVSITISHLIDISSITRYYLLQSSTSAAPAKPTTNPPSSSWTKTEPSYTSGSTNTLYFVECTEFTNGTFKYSEVSKSSSYEAAKEAYNKAAAVETRVTNAETAIEQNKEDIALRATKTEVTNYVASRGENLVTNGTALLRNNTNFSGFIYDGTDAYYSGGSFTVTSKYAIKVTDEYIPVDVSQKYTLSYYIKSTSSSAIYYDMLDMYDIDKNHILTKYIKWVPGSTTVLTQDLNPGDTVMHLQSIAGFNKTATYATQLGVIIWNYKNSKGYQYPIETYSRNVYRPLWDGETAFDTENNTITLTQAWNKGTIPAGTSLSQSNGGDSYNYLNYRYTVPADTWTQKKSIISGIGKNGVRNKFLEGTAFVKVGWLINYTNDSSITSRLSTVSLTQNANQTDIDAVNNEIDNVRDDIDAQGVTLNKTITDYVTTIQANTDSISTSVKKMQTDFNESTDNLESKISTLQQQVSAQITEEAVDIRIEERLQNGVNKVETTTGFKFDENGLNINKSGSPTDTQITENGMTVNNTETGTTMLTADKDGVEARNLSASTYMIVGDRSRFQNLVEANRTGCFWIGG